MHFLFPSNPMNLRLPDETFGDQIAALADVGFSTSLVSDSLFEEGKPLKGIPPGVRVVYRGWMLREREYTQLTSAIEAADGIPFISRQEYLAAHHLPNWYPLIQELTPETRTYSAEAALVKELQALNWNAFFVKDFVKSLKTSVGSLIKDPGIISSVVAEMKKYRGDIEGGICVRRVEEFLPDTERRYFVINKYPYGADDSQEIPQIVKACAERIPSRFFSVDVAMRRDGVLRVVEIGDGQVSDIVGWPAAAYARMWMKEMN